MKDIAVGAITGYNFDAIAPWVNSLERSGFDGDKAMICYNVSYDTVDELNRHDVKVIGFEPDDTQRCLRYSKQNFNIVCERFFHLWSVLKDLKGQYRYIITTDVKDVIFQRNPSEWLTANLGRTNKDSYMKIVASSESMYYKDEDHSNFAMLSNYGQAIYDEYKDKLIYNAGVMAGDFDTMIDLFMQIYLLCNAAPSHWNQHGGGPDQPAYNLLIHSKPWTNIALHTPSEDGWAAQLGTTGSYIADRYGHLIVDPAPIMIDGKVCTTNGEPFYIVHQYDRIPEWKPIILEQYK